MSILDFPVKGGGRIIADPHADLLQKVTKCESLWGANACPNPPLWIIVCQNVRGFTVCCEPHAINFAMNVDPHDGSYVYMTLDQFERAKAHGLYKDVQTFQQFQRVHAEAITSYAAAVEVGLMP